MCVCELPLSHLFHQLSGGYAHQSKSSALLCSSCVCVRVREEWVGHQSRLRDGMNIKFKKKNETTHCSATSPAYISTLKRVLFHSYFHLSWCAMVCLCTGFISLHSIPILITLFFTPPCFVSEWRDGGE